MFVSLKRANIPCILIISRLFRLLKMIFVHVVRKCTFGSDFEVVLQHTFHPVKGTQNMKKKLIKSVKTKPQNLMNYYFLFINITQKLKFCFRLLYDRKLRGPLISVILISTILIQNSKFLCHYRIRNHECSEAFYV